MGWVALKDTDLNPRDRAVVSVCGVRGIGSIYCLCYSCSHREFSNVTQLWSLVAPAILLSPLLHGFSVGWAMDNLKDDQSTCTAITRVLSSRAVKLLLMPRRVDATR